MDNQQREWLLQALSHTDDATPEDPPCETIRDQLGLYIESELLETDATQRFPAIFNHIYTCPECRLTYDILRDTLIDNEFLALETPPLTTASPLALRGLDFSAAIDWATEQIASWQHTLPGRGLVYRSSAPQALPPVAIPGHADAALTLTVVFEPGSLSVAGTLYSTSYALQGRTLRLYALAPPPMTTISSASEATLDDFDSFSFEAFPPGRYVLTMVLPDGEVGLTYIGEPNDQAS